MKRIISMLLAIIAAATFVFGQTENKTNDKTARELGEFESDLTTASLNRDSVWLERFFAGKFTVAPLTPDETIKNRASEIAALVERAVPTNSLTPRDVKVRITGNIFVLGGNASAAILTGRLATKGKFEGRENGGQYRATRVYAKRAGRWQVVANQITSIAKQ